MDELKKIIDLKPLSDENIKLHKYALADLWMVKDENNKVFGPYPTDELRDYSQKYKYLFDNVKVYNLENETWYNIFEVKHFQRRKPKLVSAQNLIADSNFYVLVNGQKQGPYTLQKMQQFLNNGSILPHSQISLDNGHSWIKLYEHHAFDRRSKKKNEDLPFIPDQKILSEMNSIELKAIEEDPLIELAQLKLKTSDKTSHIKINQNPGIKTKTQVIQNPLIDEQISKEVKKTKSEWMSKLAMVTAGLAVISGLFFIGNYFLKNFDRTPAQAITKKTETKSIDNSERSLAKKIKRKPASIKKSNFKKPQRVKAKRYIAKPTRIVERFNERRDRRETEEPLDINDPLVQKELTRKLAGDEEYDDVYPDEEEFQDPPLDEGSDEEETYPEEQYPEERSEEGFYDQAEEGRENLEYDAPYEE